MPQAASGAMLDNLTGRQSAMALSVRPLRSGVILATLAVLLLPGCGAGGSDPPATGTPAFTSHQPDLTDLALEPDDIEHLGRAGGDHAAAGEDGILTFAEYESAVLRTVACWEGVGYALTHGMRMTAYGYIYIEYAWSPAIATGPATEASQAAARECVREHLEPTHSIWSRHKVKTVPESLFVEARRVLWACIDETGLDLGGRAPGPEAIEYLLGLGDAEALAPLAACSQRVFDELDLPGWLG